MKTGATVSGGMHIALVVFAVFGEAWFSSTDDEPLRITQVSTISGAEFDAALSTAPVVPNEGPAELAPPSERLDAIDVAEAADDLERAGDPELAAPSEDIGPAPERPEISFVKPVSNIPSEPPRPSIAELPTVDSVPQQAAVPESAPATEPLQPLASAVVATPAPAPQAPPLVEEEAPADEVVEEKPEQEPDPESLAQAEPDAPLGPAPQEAKIPVARPAERAAAAPAASEPEPAKPRAPAKRPEREPPTETQTAEAEEPPEQPAEAAPEKPAQPSGSSAAFAATMTRGEKDALVVGLKNHFTYPGNRSDRSLRVTMEIRLSEAGKITDGPELISAEGGDQASQRALFQAGRRALIKAQNAGEFQKLPRDKYAAWKLMRVTFTPEEIGFSS
ncbi:MAG: hypothetical protein AAF713_07005 [Pseudomonadota bacterium]